MRNATTSLLLFLLFAATTASFSNDGAPESRVKVISFSELKEVIDRSDDTLRIVNFWATWCVPCIRELPHFERTAIEMSGKPVEFIFVSLDFAENLESRVVPFLTERNTPGKHYLLDDPRANYWIPQVSAEWTGAIPATLMILNENKIFHEGMMSYEQLNSVIRSLGI